MDFVIRRIGGHKRGKKCNFRLLKIFQTEKYESYVAVNPVNTSCCANILAICSFSHILPPVWLLLKFKVKSSHLTISLSRKYFKVIEGLN